METLSYLIEKAKQGGFISGFKVEGKGVEGIHILYLLFANHTLLSSILWG